MGTDYLRGDFEDRMRGLGYASFARSGSAYHDVRVRLAWCVWCAAIDTVGVTATV
jgi:hypothetical protein